MYKISKFGKLNQYKKGKSFGADGRFKGNCLANETSKNF